MVVTFAQVMLFYVLLTVSLSFLGNYLSGYSYQTGFIIGLIISAILWFTVGKKMVDSN